MLRGRDGHLDSVELLLECRADVDVSSSSCIAGMTACALQAGILALYIRLLLVVDCLGSLTGGLQVPVTGIQFWKQESTGEVITALNNAHGDEPLRSRRCDLR